MKHVEDVKVGNKSWLSTDVDGSSNIIRFPLEVYMRKVFHNYINKNLMILVYFEVFKIFNEIFSIILYSLITMQEYEKFITQFL
jgi:hypothetical protein